MNRKKIGYILLPVFALALFAGGSAVRAQGWLKANLTPEEVAKNQQTMFETHASVLGISVDEAKKAWSEGKNMRDLAVEKGISTEQLQAKMSEIRKTQMSAQLKTLVEKGVITQAQADQRLKAMESRVGTGKGAGRGGCHGGSGGGMMRGFGNGI